MNCYLSIHWDQFKDKLNRFLFGSVKLVTDPGTKENVILLRLTWCSSNQHKRYRSDRPGYYREPSNQPITARVRKKGDPDGFSVHWCGGGWGQGRINFQPVQ